MAERTIGTFAEIVLQMRRGQDYDILIRNLGAPLTITAIHGGGIEPLTGHIANEIAGQEHNLYVLRGLRTGDNSMMRIPSLRFSEMYIDSLLQGSQAALNIEGIAGDDLAVRLGGPNKLLLDELCERLEQIGIKVVEPAFPEAACAVSQFYNRPMLKGVHLELTTALRQTMVNQPLPTCCREEQPPVTDVFRRFVAAVRAAIKSYQGQANVDLDLTMQRFETATAAMPPSIRKPGQHHHH